MFDDQNTPQPSSPVAPAGDAAPQQPAEPAPASPQSTAASSEPKDIFQETDNVESPPTDLGGAPSNLPTAPPSAAPTPAAAPATQPSPQPAPQPVEPAGMGGGKTLPAAPKPEGGAGKVILIIVGVMIIVAVAGALAYFFLMQSPSGNGDTGVLDSEISDDEDVEMVDLEDPVQQEPVDSDGDGLTDDEETTVGTDPLNPDSDKDGLGDKEEVKTYGTDPLDPDTDDDSFLDGQEVLSGYNPNGDGKLYDIPK